MRRRRDDEPLLIVRERRGAVGVHRGVQAPPPGVEARQPIGGRGVSLVRDVVADARISVHRGDVRTHRRRQQARRDRKIFIMRPRQRLARSVGRREPLGPTGHQGILRRDAVTRRWSASARVAA